MGVPNRYTAILVFNPDDGWWTATCAEIPAAITQGRTEQEARENLKEAITLVLETQRELAVREAGGAAKVEEILVATP
jgi:predicted RNase H-like HicB family nuclease